MTDKEKAPDLLRSQEPSLSAGTSLVGSGNGKNTDAVKRLLPPGLFMTDDHKYYFNGNGPVPSVTTVTDALMKWDLMAWKQRETARAMIQIITESAASMKADDMELDLAELPDQETEDGLIQLAIKRADKKRDDAAKIGTGVHLLADMHSRGDDRATDGFEVPDEWIPYLDAFKGFLTRYDASSIVSSEKAVWSENGYAGTYDLIMRIEDQLCLVDIKTSRGIYAEHGLQLAAYRWADAIILPGDPRPYPMPQIDRTYILHLRPDKYPDTGYRLVEYGTTYMDDYIPFLGVLEAVKWRLKGRFTRTQLQKQSSI